MILQSKDRFDELAELDPMTGKISFFSKKANPQLARCPANGCYAELDGHWLALYVVDGKNVLKVDGAVYMVCSKIQTRLVRGESKNTLIVLDAGKPLLRLEYRRPKIDPPLEIDETPFVEEEDHDFALFVHNVLSDNKRRETFLKANT